MNIYFSGLGGVGIGPLVDIAIDAGYDVQGSDLQRSVTSDALQSRGVMMEIGTQDGKFLEQCHQQKPIDLLVYTAALAEDHPELVLAKQLGIKTVKRYGFLADFIGRHQLTLLAVAGTHGKTTTTGMLIWTLQQLGVPISHLIGTTIGFGPAGRFDPTSKYFVLECDEFERHLLEFSPELSILTSIDYDHPDSYPTKDDYIATFRQFIEQSHRVILWQKDAGYLGVDQANARILLDDAALDLPFPGEHNRQNGTLVVEAISQLAIADTDEAKAALSSFPGTGRRFEKLADNLYSDYGHHPVEIAATLKLARELSDHVVLVYQPHQNRRQHHIKDDYRDQFELAEEVYWLPTYLSREDPSQAILTPEQLTASLTNQSSIHFAEQDDALWETIQSARRSGKLVIVMGAGDIDTWARRHAQVT